MMTFKLMWRNWRWSWHICMHFAFYKALQNTLKKDWWYDDVMLEIDSGMCVPIVI